MNKTEKLFRLRDIYDLSGSDELFAEAMRENVIYHYNNCQQYKSILDRKGFDPYSIHTVKDIARLPFLTTQYLKRHSLVTESSEPLVTATSSGTSGKATTVGYDIPTMLNDLVMCINVGKYHKLWSAVPVNYIVFGYRPDRENTAAAAKTAYLFTFMAPAVSRTFALERVNGEYRLAPEKIIAALKRSEASGFPLRTMGFPAYTYFFMRELERRKLHFKMPKGSLIALGGGWKSYYKERPEKEEFYRLARETLGIPESRIFEFFGAAEHPILYTDCRCHRFHIPVYSRVIIRDVDTLEPLPHGNVGIVDLITPLFTTSPLCSIVTDDLGIIHDEPCPCGCKSPTLEIIGRVGASGVRTCAQGAEKYLKEGAV